MIKEFNILTVFYGVVALQGYIVTIALFIVSKGNRKANRILGMLTLLLSYYLTDFFLGQIKFFYDYPHLLHVSTPMWYLFAPLSYYYILIVLKKKQNFKLVDLFHILPFLFIVYRFRQFYLLPGDIKLMYWTGELLPPEGNFFNYLVALINPVQGLIYTGYILFIISSVNRNIKSIHVSEAQLKWLKSFFTLMLLYYISSFSFINLYFSNILYLDFMPHVHLGVFAFIIYGIGFVSINNPDRLFPKDIIQLKTKSKTIFTNEQADYYKNLLNELMRNKKYYLKHDLMYSDIATDMGISVRQFSEFLNKVLGVSFSDFINNYRVNEVKDRIGQKTYETNTLFSIALDSGFCSKASFNRIFKKHTGMTPSQYINKIESEISILNTSS